MKTDSIGGRRKTQNEDPAGGQRNPQECQGPVETSLIGVLVLSPRTRSVPPTAVVRGFRPSTDAVRLWISYRNSILQNYFLKYGYLEDFADSSDETLFAESLKNFQKFVGLNVTGKIIFIVLREYVQRNIDSIIPFHHHSIPPSLHSIPPSFHSTIIPFHHHSIPPSLHSTITPFHHHSIPSSFHSIF